MLRLLFDLITSKRLQKNKKTFTLNPVVFRNML